jgi:curli biogenesis system outer membrane secretion channel CsgG/S1-C subfamily serine protease/Tfp pilus assembly protein PilF
MTATPRFRLLLALLLAWCVGVAAAAGLGLRLRDAPGGGGAEVTQVVADSPAARAGLQAGDLIREAGGRLIPGAAALVESLKAQGVGQTVPLIVERGGWRRQMLLAGESSAPAGQPSATPRLGLRVADADAGGPAARVTGVEAGSPAANAGLAVGDLILEAQGRAIGGAGDFAALVRGLDGAASLELRISRDGWRRTVRLAAAGADAPQAAAQAPCSRGRLGIQIQDGAGSPGVEVVEVEPDGAAAGVLRRGDRITAVDGRAVSRSAELAGLVGASAPGRSLALALERDGAGMQLELRVGALPEFDCLLERGDQQVDAGKWEEAGRLYDAAIRLQPKRLEGWARMAQLLDRQGDLKGAIESERRALAAVGEHAGIHARIGWYQQRLGLPDDARESSQRALRLDPHSSGAHATLASLAIARQDWDAAILHLRQFLEVQPDAAAAWGDLGLVLAGAGRDEEASAAFQRSLALDPGPALTWFNSGLNLRRLGREPEAVAHLNRAVELDPQGDTGRMARQQLTPAMVNPVGSVAGAAATVRSDRRRASVAVGDFQVKAAKANQQIGDGLREMFLTSLHESGYFNVVERMGIQGIAAEQALSRSAMGGPGAALPEGQMDVADIMVYGVVSEFEPEAGGMAFSNFLPQMGMAVRQSTKFSEMAIDVRAVDVRTGRVLVAQRIPGTAQAYGAGLGGRISGGGLSMPVGLGAFRNTPMELAVRDCIQKATYFVINQIPQDYFRHP